MEGYHRHINGDGLVCNGVHVHDHVFVYSNATIHGGNIRGGNIYGGNIYGGVIRGGNIYGGCIRREAVIEDHEDIESGCIGGYPFAVYPDKDRSVWMQYGCEYHPLTWWDKQTSRLSVTHGHSRQHAVGWFAVRNLARQMQRRIK